MLLYGKSWWGIGSIFRLEGSSIPRAMPLVVLSTFGCILLSMFCSDWLSDRIMSYSTFTIFSSIVSFVLVFRVGNSLNRYWEARGAVQTFSAKLCDTASLLVHCAHENTRERNAQGKCNEEEDRRTAELCGRVLHLASLTHAVALQVRSEDFHSFPPCFSLSSSVSLPTSTLTHAVYAAVFEEGRSSGKHTGSGSCWARLRG